MNEESHAAEGAKTAVSLEGGEMPLFNKFSCQRHHDGAVAGLDPIGNTSGENGRGVEAVAVSSKGDRKSAWGGSLVNLTKHIQRLCAGALGKPPVDNVVAGVAATANGEHVYHVLGKVLELHVGAPVFGVALDITGPLIVPQGCKRWRIRMRCTHWPVVFFRFSDRIESWTCTKQIGGKLIPTGLIGTNIKN